MANTKTSDVTGFVPNFYSKVFLERLTPGPIMLDYCVKKPLPQNNGKVAYFPRMVNSSTMVSAYKLTEGTAVTPELIDDAQVSATIEQFGNAKGISDLLELTAISDTVTETVKELADQASNIIDIRTIEEAYGTSAKAIWGGGFSVVAYNTASNADLGTSTSAFYTYVGTAEYRVNVAGLRFITKKLKALNVKPFEDGFYAMICHSDTAMQLQADSVWQNSHIYTDPENMFRGVAGMIAGVKIHVDNNIKTSAYGSAGATLYHSIVLGKGALGATMLDGGIKTYFKRPDDSSTNDPINQFITIGWKANFVPKILNVSCGLILVTADA